MLGTERPPSLAALLATWWRRLLALLTKATTSTAATQLPVKRAPRPADPDINETVQAGDFIPSTPATAAAPTGRRDLPRMIVGATGRHYAVAPASASGPLGELRLAVDDAGNSWAVQVPTGKIDDKYRQFLKSRAGYGGIHDEVTGEGNPLVVMPLPVGTLQNILEGIAEQPMRKALGRLMVAQVTQELQQIHQRGFVQRNISLANLSCTPAAKIVVGEFSQARAVDDKGQTRCPVPAAAAFCAPEMLYGSTCSAKIDLWAVGAAFAAIHSIRLARLLAMAARTPDILTAYIHWRQQILSLQGPWLPHLKRRTDRLDAYLADVAQADAEMCDLLVRHLLDPVAKSRASAGDVAQVMRKLQPPKHPSERDAARLLSSLVNRDKKREAALHSLREQARRIHGMGQAEPT